MKKTKRLITVLLIFTLVLSMSIPVMAASKVKINKTKTTMYVGQTTTLKISGTKSKAKWSSSKKSVATVTSKGTVTAKKKGFATITAKIGNKKYTCKVTVKNPYLNKTTLALDKGDTYTLKLTGSKAKLWTSSNKSVATVNNKGKVTAKKNGTTTITAKASNNKKYTCKVTVNASDNDDGSGDNTDNDSPDNDSDNGNPDDSTPDNGNPDDSTHEHKYTSQITKQPTCTETGIKTFTCSCGNTYTETIPATGHNFSDEVIAPTCTELGYTIHTCSKCGFSFSDNYIDALGHNWSDWVIINEPTETETGLKKRTCSICKAEETNVIPVKTHEHNYTSKVIAATCTEQGYTTYTCSICGDSYNDNYVDALGHDYINKVVAPTCTMDGYTSHTCSRCGDTYNDNYVDALGHDYEWVVAKEATCTEAGLKEYKCRKCGEISGKTEIPAKHSYGDWTITKEPSSGAATTAADFGTRQRTCSVCNHVDEQTIINIDLGNGETKQMCGVFADDMAYETFDMVNKLRASLGLDELRWFDNFSDIAHIRAVEIDYSYGHPRPNGSGTVRYPISDSLSIALGENIWAGYTVKSAQIAFDGWCESEGHYSNIVKPSYTEYYASCFIVYDSNEHPWYNWVQIFY